jgi:predicted RNA-binding protein YlxR (DUF448 family)
MSAAQAGKLKGPRPKHVPQRTCVICRSERGKRELVRIVRTPAGAVQVDPTGKVAGRGAYLCKAQPCWNAPGFAQRLNAALKTTLTAEDTAALKAYAGTLPVE